MHFTSDQIGAMIIGTSFAAGLNVYATVGCLGLLSRFNLIHLPGPLHGLESWWIISAASVLFAIEFFADKIPAFDLVWNALHTLVRVPVAAYLSYAASAHFSPQVQLATTVLGAGIAFAAHSGKTALRAAVTPSPEPFSNVALSTGEDVLAIGLAWGAATHPFIAAGVVVVLLVAIGLAVRWVVGSLRRLFRGRFGGVERA
jgi:hypothetical protein